MQNSRFKIHNSRFAIHNSQFFELKMSFRARLSHKTCRSKGIILYFEFSSSAGGGSPKGDPPMTRFLEKRGYSANILKTVKPAHMAIRTFGGWGGRRRRAPEGVSKSEILPIILNYALAISMKSTHAVAPAIFSRAAHATACAYPLNPFLQPPPMMKKVSNENSRPQRHIFES